MNKKLKIFRKWAKKENFLFNNLFKQWLFNEKNSIN